MSRFVDGDALGGVPTENLRYMQALLRQLRDKAFAQREPMLAHLIEMAELEVTDILRQSNLDDFEATVSKELADDAQKAD